MATQAKTDTLASAMASAFAEIEAATKDAKNPHFKSNYATLGAVVEAVKPALINHGLFFTQETHDASGGVCVETVIRHASGDEIRCGRLFVPANKNDAQGFGSALTYARRYSLMTAFGVSAEDDDGNAAAASSHRAAANDARPIDDAQWAHLVSLIEAKAVDTQRFCRFMKVNSLKEIPSARFGEAVDALRSKPDPVKPKPDPAPNQQRSEELADEIPY